MQKALGLSQDEAHIARFDEATEAPTPTGWTRYTDLQDGETIAAFDNQRQCLIWQAANFHRYSYDGEVESFRCPWVMMAFTGSNMRCFLVLCCIII